MKKEEPLNPFKANRADGEAPKTGAGDKTQPLKATPADTGAKPVDLPPPAAATPKPSEPAKPKEAAKPSEPAPKPVSPQPSVHGIARSAPVTPQTQLPPVAVAAENEEKADNKLPTLLAGGALLIAVIALLLALLGGKGDRTVETADLGAEAVTTDKIANGAVTAEKLDPDAVPEGPRGPKGETGPTGPRGPKGAAGAPGIGERSVVSQSTVADSSTTKELTVNCRGNSEVLYGGAAIVGLDGQVVRGVALVSSMPTEDRKGWQASAAESSRNDAIWRLDVKAVCTTFGSVNGKGSNGKAGGQGKGQKAGSQKGRDGGQGSSGQQGRGRGQKGSAPSSRGGGASPDAPRSVRPLPVGPPEVQPKPTPSR